MEKATLPEISVVIPAYNEEKLLPGCLESVVNQDFERLRYEIVVADNASTDKTVEIAKKANARVVHEPKKGYVFALRKGIEAARGEIVAVTDADARAPKDWLKKISHHFEKDSQLSGLGGIYSFFDGNFLVRRVFSFLLKNFVFEMVGPNMAFRKKAYERIGGFVPEINLAADAFFSFKMRSVGRIKIDHSSQVLVSSRRFHLKHLKHLILYVVNYFYLLLFHQPLFLDFPDIR